MNNDSKVAHVTVASNAEYLNISNQDSMNKLNENGLRLLDSNNYRTKSTIFIGKVSNVIMNTEKTDLLNLINESNTIDNLIAIDAFCIGSMLHPDLPKNNLKIMFQSPEMADNVILKWTRYCWHRV